MNEVVSADHGVLINL